MIGSPRAALTVALLCALAPSIAQAASGRATLHASFAPDRLGAPTTITFGFHLAPPKAPRRRR